jgi:hypothetical protein
MTPTTSELACLDDRATDGAGAALQPRTEAERCGFQIGWDHARHGLVPPPALLIDGTPVGQGWRAGKAVFGLRKLPTTPSLRLWLRLRADAWAAGIAFDGATVTPKWLARIAVSHCPVTRQPLGGAPGADSAAVTVCLDTRVGYRAGNLVVMSRRAASAMAGLDLRSALRQAALPGGTPATVRASDSAVPELSPQQMARLAVLLSQRIVLPFCDAARVPLRLLPPPHVQPVNALQLLQLGLTRQFATPGWSTRLRALADLLPADAHGQPDTALRHDFNLFIGAMAPRLLGAGAGVDGRLPDTVLEDAWADERVQRRWQRFAAALGEARTAAMLGRMTSASVVCADRSRFDPGRLGAGRGLGLRRPTLAARMPRKVSRSAGAAAHAHAR